ncbi:hypothetical protein [Actinacidiphila sp. bgisy145]|uniref:hypothetical protein n=1 Tax=Actinacidiphila sp. bgisy145 TaxID=3413792 RepID=UPI003EB91076
MADAAAHLATVIRLWPDLADALVARQQATWPPTMGVARLLDADEREHAAAHRYLDRDPAQLGEVPAPIRLDLLDTMREVEQHLVHTADIVAAEVQRPAMSRAPRHWLAADRARRDQLAAADAADPRRWRYPGARTAPLAAAWLTARLAGAPGPFLRLNSRHRAAIETTARRAADRIETSLEMARRTTAVRWPCPHCRGQLTVSGGDGQPPAVRCEDCGWTRRAHQPA